jgi:hypothetical protein
LRLTSVTAATWTKSNALGTMRILQRKKESHRVRVHHKILNGRLKNWRILSQIFCHHILLHQDVFQACTVVTQVTMENGELLFEV